jgi:hypothetical protein
VVIQGRPTFLLTMPARHSAGRKFKESELQFLKRRCACAPQRLERVKRSPWMRLLPGVRAYQCQVCGARFLAFRKIVGEIAVAQRREAFGSRPP